MRPSVGSFVDRGSDVSLLEQKAAAASWLPGRQTKSRPDSILVSRNCPRKVDSGRILRGKVKGESNGSGLTLIDSNLHSHYDECTASSFPVSRLIDVDSILRIRWAPLAGCVPRTNPNGSLFLLLVPPQQCQSFPHHEHPSRASTEWPK
ncbi:hypothetical protein CEE69_26750 [Rhodopirellula bahusiensis]|uniref:Uncharacterized protein n=1 Tax=Rhodopirellula bahusiensis TaxID=2014065 RepID=A0A2G1VZN1_9BACT|nr:hypothetical protein CEE69_26750 [Rhodopirellula bahusiensis]